MLALKHLVASVVLAAVMPVIAAPTTFIDFEGSPLDPTLAGDAYKALGVVFTDNAYVLRSNFSSPTPAAGGNFLRYGDPSKSALGLFSTAGASSADFFINVAAGFGETFSLLYTTTDLAGGLDFIELFSGENGTGSVINAGSRPDPAHPGQTLPGASLVKQADCKDPTGTPQPGVYCTWAQIALDFTGTAKSVHISGASGVYFFDNLAFGAAPTTTPPAGVPEPGGIALSLAALGAMAWTRKRYQR